MVPGHGTGCDVGGKAAGFQRTFPKRPPSKVHQAILLKYALLFCYFLLLFSNGIFLIVGSGGVNRHTGMKMACVLLTG